MKIINENIIVQPDPATKWLPGLIEWEHRVCVVEQVVDYWKIETQWWGKPVERLYVIVMTDHGIMEIFRERDFWTLYRIHD